MTIVALRRVGIDEAFVQQAAEDEEAEFQRAFGVELAVGLVASLAIALLAPVLAAVYDDDRLLALTLAVAYLPVAFSLQAPQWVFFRRMDFLRLRLLQAIVPLGTVLVTVPLLLAGVGVWALVIGPFCAHVAAVIAAAAVSPYRLRPRFERDAARRYLRFSWPVFVTAVAALAVAQGQVARVRALRGRARGGGLDHARGDAHALRRPRGPDRRDDDLPGDRARARPRRRARGAVREVQPADADVGVPVRRRAGAVRRATSSAFVLGDEWEPAVVLLGGLAAATALQQLGYNWFAFYRARGESRPQAVESAVFAGSFAVLAVPATLAWGSWGFVAGRLACTVVRAGGAAALRAAAAAGRAARGDRAAGGAAGAVATRAGAGAAARAVGRRAAARRRRWRSWRCGWPGSCSRPAGSSRACSASCGATCDPAASGETTAAAAARRRRPARERSRRRCCGSRRR